MSLDRETRNQQTDPELSETKDPITGKKTSFKEIALSVISNSNTVKATDNEPIRTHVVTRPQIYTDFSPNRKEPSHLNENYTEGYTANILRKVESNEHPISSEANTAQSPMEQHASGENQITSNELVEEVRTQIYTDFNPTQPQRLENTSPENTSSTNDFKKTLDGDLPPQIFGGYSPTRPVQYDCSPTHVAAERPQTLPIIVNYNPRPSGSDCPHSSPDSTELATATPSTQLRLNENLQECNFPAPPPPYSAIDTTAETSRNVITTQPQINYVNRDGLQKGIIYSARPRNLTCPYCLRQVLTNHRKEIGVKVHLVGIGCLLLGCMPFCVLAYVTDFLKDDNHYCPSCGRMIGTEVPVPN